MIDFHHLADDELLVIFEELSNKRHRICRKQGRFSRKEISRLLDIDGELDVVRNEYKDRTGLVLNAN